MRKPWAARIDFPGCGRPEGCPRTAPQLYPLRAGWGRARGRAVVPCGKAVWQRLLKKSRFCFDIYMYVCIFVPHMGREMGKTCFTREELEKIAYGLKAISHPNRLAIICLLSRNEELNVSEICEQMECSQALVSHHLTDMYAKGILEIRREGRNAFYRLADERVPQVMRCMMKWEKP